jgi:hypothetical protein
MIHLPVHFDQLTKNDIRILLVLDYYYIEGFNSDVWPHEAYDTLERICFWPTIKTLLFRIHTEVFKLFTKLLSYTHNIHSHHSFVIILRNINSLYMDPSLSSQ